MTILDRQPHHRAHPCGAGRSANEWEWLDRAPALRIYPEPKRRVRWLTPGQLTKLLQELPEHQCEAVIFAVATGLRQANVVGLEWSQVNPGAKTLWIHADQAKGRLKVVGTSMCF